MTVQILRGDCRELLKTLPSDSVHCCVTSPPYWGLRSYLPDGHPEKHLEIGGEPTLEAWVQTMVEVFREVRRVLRPDGTLWLNLGDAYAGQRAPGGITPSARRDDEPIPRSDRAVAGLKPKDMMGQPWRVAFALQQPYYTGQIKNEADRVWLAAIIDGEGCFFIHKRKAGTAAHSKFTRADGSEANYSRTADTYGAGLEICNTNLAIIQRVQAVAGAGTTTSQSPAQNNRRKQTIYRWRVGPNEAKRIAQECYPHLVGKQHQARLLFACPSSGEAGAAAHQAMMDLHNGIPTSVDYPPPPSLFEPGWYLRQECIWSKSNPMPESVRDRCTKAHEHVFLLAKSERYFYDFDAMQEPTTGGANPRTAGNKTHKHTAAYESGDEKMRTKGGLLGYDERQAAKRAARQPQVKGWATEGKHDAQAWARNEAQGKYRGNGVGFGHGTDKDARQRERVAGVNPKASQDAAGSKQNESFSEAISGELVDTRNPRTVWTIPTHGFKGAHFATFPPALAERCITAGCPEGGTVLDPFGGSGTVGMVADRQHKSAILIDLDERNVPMATERITADAGMFAEVLTP